MSARFTALAKRGQTDEAGGEQHAADGFGGHFDAKGAARPWMQGAAAWFCRSAQDSVSGAPADVPSVRFQD
jgi:hypothetical protein